MKKLFSVFLLVVGFSMQGVCMNEEVHRLRDKVHLDGRNTCCE